jgi:serine/threonine protein kinase
VDHLTGRTLGNYRIVARIGRGGMATVYQAYQPALERYVAIKVLHRQLAEDDPQFVKRFQREAKAVASLRHPNIIQVFDFGVDDEVPYMVMEYVAGRTLKTELNALAERGEVMSLDAVSTTFQAVAGALAYAHGRGMVHRDIKPANVMLTTKGDVILMDFGVARIVGATQYTATGAVVGTPAYLSPEQGKGERGDERSDIYAMGVVLYEMITGRVPFDADTPLAVIFKHISDPLPLPRHVNPRVPEEVEGVILKAMAKEPSERYQTVEEMARALANAIAVSGPVPEDELVNESADVDTPDEPVEPVGTKVDEPGIATEPRSQRQVLQYSRRTWRGIAIALFLIAISWGVCGLVFGAVPTESSEVAGDSDSTTFWITRGCFLGPAFALMFLTYVAFTAGRRKDRTLHCGEVILALGVAMGLLLTLLGIAIMAQPTPAEDDAVFASLLCILPGLFIIVASGAFWGLVLRKR